METPKNQMDLIKSSLLQLDGLIRRNVDLRELNTKISIIKDTLWNNRNEILDDLKRLQYIDEGLLVDLKPQELNYIKSELKRSDKAMVYVPRTTLEKLMKLVD
jgi:hypothetical protein